MQAEVSCPHCNLENPSGSDHCSRCGTTLIGEPPERTAKTRNPATRRGLIRRLKHWWNKRRRRAK